MGAPIKPSLVHNPAPDTSIPSAWGDAVNELLDYLRDELLPIGSIVTTAAAAAPNDSWLLCDGQEVSRSTYSELFAAIGTTYGVGNGSTTFNLPNLKGRVPVHRDASDNSFNSLGETGGAKTHTLTINEMPGHNHGDTSVEKSKHVHNVTDFVGPLPGAPYFLGTAGTPFAALDHPVMIFTGYSTGTDVQSHAHAVLGVGGGQAHNNLQPYIVLNFIIRAT